MIIILCDFINRKGCLSLLLFDFHLFLFNDLIFLIFILSFLSSSKTLFSYIYEIILVNFLFLFF